MLTRRERDAFGTDVPRRLGEHSLHATVVGRVVTLAFIAFAIAFGFATIGAVLGLWTLPQSFIDTFAGGGG